MREIYSRKSNSRVLFYLRTMFVLSDIPSVANNFMAEMRNVTTQRDRMRFRRNLERLGEVLAYEISKSFVYSREQIETPLATHAMLTSGTQPVIISVLRASLPFYQGFLNFFDQAESGFIGAFREEGNSGDISINLGYRVSPSIQDKTVILTDPMLATGKSLIQSIEALKNHGTPSHLHVAAVVAAPEGIAYLHQNLTIPFTLWVGAVDEKLNSSSFIVPGLGDAGDLAFGNKI